jgi:hypothetical protein
MSNGNNDGRNEMSGPLAKRRTLSATIRKFNDCLHLPARKTEVAREIVELVDRNPWLNDQLPYDLAGIVRRSAEVTR